MNKNKSVNIIIPLYSNILNGNQKLSLDRCFSVLSAYQITAVVPEDLDVVPIAQSYPLLKFEKFKSDFFKGREGYNKLMMSATFYQRFVDWDYILIYQSDAYVFFDNLQSWANRGYDYVGAPWLEKPIYKSLLYRVVRYIDYKLHFYVDGYSERHLVKGKVGNGGLSLRKVSSFLSFIESNRERVELYCQRCNFHRYHEDVFWALEPKDIFVYPNETEALGFSFDKYPSLCYRLNNNTLPFGCHAFYHKRNIAFWRRFIPKINLQS